jgi:hypothetical protein
VAGDHQLQRRVLAHTIRRPLPEKLGALAGGQLGIPRFLVRRRGDAGDAVPPVWVQHTEGADGERIADDPAQHPVSQLPSTYSVPMHHQRAPIPEIELHRAIQHLDSHLVLQESPAPGIVVPSHEGDGDAGLDQLREPGEHPVVLAEDHATVLEPEVEEIAVDQQPGAVLLHVGEEVTEGALRRARHTAQVNVGNHEERFAFHSARETIPLPGGSQPCFRPEPRFDTLTWLLYYPAGARGTPALPLQIHLHSRSVRIAWS